MQLVGFKPTRRLSGPTLNKHYRGPSKHFALTFGLYCLFALGAALRPDDTVDIASQPEPNQNYRVLDGVTATCSTRARCCIATTPVRSPPRGSGYFASPGSRAKQAMGPAVASTGGRNGHCGTLEVGRQKTLNVSSAEILQQGTRLSTNGVRMRVNISLDESHKSTFLDQWATYRRSCGKITVVAPPMSGPNLQGDITFYRVPGEFLDRLKESGIPYRIDSPAFRTARRSRF